MATDITQRLSTQPGYFKIHDPHNKVDARKIVDVAVRVVSPDTGKPGVPVASHGDKDFWTLDHMNNWHLTVHRMGDDWHCVIQFRYALMDQTLSTLMSVYSVVIMHQVKTYHMF